MVFTRNVYKLSWTWLSDVAGCHFLCLFNIHKVIEETLVATEQAVKMRTFSYDACMRQPELRTF